jgi:ketosteroid isomerase-like protein
MEYSNLGARMAGAALLGLLLGCRPGPPNDDAGTLARTRQDLTEATARYVAASRGGDAHALAALYEERAILLPPDDEPVEGRAAIEAYWHRALEDGLELHTTRVEASGPVAYSIGRWSLPATDSEAADSGKLVLCWKRVDGIWQLTADIWNSSVQSDSTDADANDSPGDRIPIT